MSHGPETMKGVYSTGGWRTQGGSKDGQLSSCPPRPATIELSNYLEQAAVRGLPVPSHTAIRLEGSPHSRSFQVPSIRFCRLERKFLVMFLLTKTQISGKLQSPYPQNTSVSQRYQDHC
eukprot:763177-Hanusia_phi.AAC.2